MPPRTGSARSKSHRRRKAEPNDRPSVTDLVDVAPSAHDERGITPQKRKDDDQSLSRNARRPKPRAPSCQRQNRER